MKGDTDLITRSNSILRLILGLLALSAVFTPGAVAFYRIGIAERNIDKIESRQNEMRDLLIEMKTDLRFIRKQVETP